MAARTKILARSRWRAAIASALLLLCPTTGMVAEKQTPSPVSTTTTPIQISTFLDAEALVRPMELVITEAYARLGRSVKIHRLPLTRSLADSNAGYYDAELGRVEENRKEAPNLIMLAEPIFFSEYRVYMRIDKAKPQLASWDALRQSGLRIAGRLGARVPESKLGSALTLRIRDQDALLKMLVDDRIDVFVGTTTTTRSRLAVLQLSQPQLAAQIQELEPALQRQPFHHFLHQRHAALAEPLNKILQQMAREGRMAALWQQSGSDGAAP